MSFTLEHEYENYGKGYPGDHWCVRLMMDGRVVASADGPNVNGPSIGEFRDMAAVRTVLAMPSGPVPDDIDIIGLLKPHYAAKVVAAVT